MTFASTSNRVADIWNYLPNDVVSAVSVIF